jgi:Protein-L-isoaspartate(D-aspartate) O-methyltransferase (PCMT)
MKKLLLLAFIAVACDTTAQDAQCVPERAAMIEIIRAYARSEASVFGPQGISERVLEAMGQTERHRFIPGRSCSVAYMDAPVLIGRGQTISQPFIVALMTHLAAVKLETIPSWKLARVQVTRLQYWRISRGRSVPLRLSHHWPKLLRMC